MKQKYKLIILGISVLILCWFSTIITIITGLAVVDGLLAYYVRVKGKLIPLLMMNVHVTDKITFINNPIPYIVIKMMGFYAFVWFSQIFVDRFPLSSVTRRHEINHVKQVYETGYVLFYCLYVIDWIYRLCTTPKSAYKNICFEVDSVNYSKSTSTHLKYYGWFPMFLM